MSIYQIGLVIRQRREYLGYTQEELADGICSVPSLSRIESGERMPLKEHTEMLLQRLGYSDTMYNPLVDKKTFLLHELKFKIRQEIILHHYSSASALLDQYEAISEKKDRISEQFLLLYRTLVMRELPAKEVLCRMEQAIRITCPKYNPEKLPKILSYEEIIILNNIATSKFNLGSAEAAIEILYSLKRYYENHLINMEEVLRTQTLVLYNLSKCLGCTERYDECIEICNVAIRIARETGRCDCLASMLYNRAWSLCKKENLTEAERNIAEESAMLALYMAKAMANQKSVEHYTKFIQTNFPTLLY